MHEEQRLISIGFPFSEAVAICHAMRREGTLTDFIREQEAMRRVDCADQVKELLNAYGIVCTVQS